MNVKKMQRVFELMDQLGVSAAEVNAWAEALDTIAVAEEDDEEMDPHDVIDANLDAHLDDPEILRLQAGDAHDALDAMGIKRGER